ncbi:MAG: TAXI family TRAP transporter solute-binding subunit, partial [Cyanobacteria bacterium P01_F01_bin.33]
MQNKSALAIAAIGMTMTVVFAGLAISDRQRVYRLTVATGSPAGQYYAFGRALSEIVARHAPHIELTVRETEGSVDNVTLLETGKVDLAIAQSDTPMQAEARAVAALFPEFFHVLAAPEAAIDRLADLRGKRIALMPERSGSYALFWQIGQHYGLTPQTVTALALPPERAHAALQAGEVDALSKTIALGNPATTDLLHTSNAQLVPIAQVKALQISLPFLEAISIPSGAYGGAPAIP